MTMWTVLVALNLLSIIADDKVESSQFDKLIKGLFEPVRDLTFAYEGAFLGGEGDRPAEIGAETTKLTFQGRYAYRSDGAVLLDLYKRGIADDERQSHSLLQNLGGVSSLEAVPDLGRLNQRSASKRKASAQRTRPSPLDRPGSPARFLFLWFFQGLTDIHSRHYDFQGWEDVDGRRCLRVELDLLAAPHKKAEDLPRLRFWLDMGRGGHPLKVESLRNGHAVSRTEHIQLERFDNGKGQPIWLPVSGDCGSLLSGSRQEGKVVLEYHPEPVQVETYRVITGSVVLNQGLSDADLTIGSAATKYSEFKNIKGEHKQRARPVRTDPKGVQKQLDEALADADSKAGRLEASAPEGTFWNWSRMASFALPILGLGLITWAGMWKWRS